MVSDESYVLHAKVRAMNVKYLPIAEAQIGGVRV